MANCRCGHHEAIHHTMGVAGSGRALGLCEACTCSGFTTDARPVVAPRPVVAAPARAKGKPDPVAAPPVGPPAEADVIELVPTTLILAWNSLWCEKCSSRSFRERDTCCARPMLPVRLEMHTREGS